MSNLDNTAATTAQNMLNGIDYGAIIGGPLQAAIKAQAMAAQSTWEFIQQVGMNTDANGNKSAVNVTFTYISNGKQVNLVVPILTIVPIPAIEITEIDISFKATINASASQSTLANDASNLDGKLDAKTKMGWGSFGLTADVTASYSSKKDSKATQDSKYSVEYTQDVTVKAAQAGLPAGLATILNILSSSAAAVPVGSELTVSPVAGQLDYTDTTAVQPLQVKVTNAVGLLQPNLQVKVSLPADCDSALAPAIMIGSGALPRSTPKTVGSGTAPTIFTTDANGAIALSVWVDKSKVSAGAQPKAGTFQLKVTTTVDGAEQTTQIPFVVNAIPALAPASQTPDTNTPTKPSDEQTPPAQENPTT